MIPKLHTRVRFPSPAPPPSNKHEVNFDPAITASRNDLLKIAAGGLLSGILTPLAPLVIDKISGAPANFGIACTEPFAVLVFIVVRRCSAYRSRRR